jgi:hypothetical protein
LTRFLIIRFLWLPCWLSVEVVVGQCPFNNVFFTTLTPACPSTVTASCVWGGEYVTVNVQAGNIYTFSTCGSTAFDSEITLYNAIGTVVLGYNDDACGLQSTLNWTATYTGQVQVLVDRFGCLSQQSCMNLNVTCTAAPPVGCQNDNAVIDYVVPFCPGEINYTCVYAGEALEVEVTQGNIYTFSTCNSPTFNSVLTLYDDTGVQVLDYNDDACGLQAEIVWQATYSGFVKLALDQAPCVSNSICMDVLITCVPPSVGGEGCNTNTLLCQNNAGPFGFAAPGPPVSSCLDWFATSQYAYILLNVTTSGTLNLLIQGDAPTGFLDVAVFNIPNGIDPCDAIQNPANELGCNYAQFSGGCNQFGSNFPCTSSIPSPSVTAGQTLMIVVEDWLNGASNSFSLLLGPPPNAQSGAATATILPAGPFCINAQAAQLTAVDMGGLWTGPGTSPDGIFTPVDAGIGTHAINYTIGQPPCVATGNTSVTVLNTPQPQITISDGEICAGETVVLTAAGGGTYNWSNGQTGPSIQVSPVSSSNFTVTVTLPGGCSAAASQSVIVQPPLNTSFIFHY